MSNDVTPIIKSRLPSFMERLYPEFVQFITTYFENLEQDGKVIQEITRFINNTDSTIENAKYWDKILADISWGLKEEFSVDKRLFILFVRHYYMSRGTAKSIHFLFKLLYNDNPKITYPRDKLMMLSNTEYTGTTTMYLKNNVSMSVLKRMQELSQNFGLVGRGVTSGASMVVDNVDVLEGYIRLFISTTNTFVPHETIELTGDSFVETFENVPVYDITPTRANTPVTEFNFSVGVVPLTITLLNSGKTKAIEIENGGRGYSVGDYVVDINGSGLYAEISEVSKTGIIRKLEILNYGQDKPEIPQLNVITSNGQNATLKAIPDDKLGQPVKVVNHSPIFNKFVHPNIEFEFKKNAIYTSPKRWRNDNHLLEHNAILLDSYYWHQFAYQIESGIARPEYEHIVKANEHPPGYEFFSQLDVQVRDTILNAFKTGRKDMNKDFLGFLYASVISNLAQRQYTVWQTNVNYTIGDLVVHEDNIYIATANGMSGYMAPKHTKDKASDGGVSWQYVQTINRDLKTVSNMYLALSLGANPVLDAFYAKRIPHTDIRLGAKYRPLIVGDIVETGKIYKTDDHQVYYCVTGDKQCDVLPLEANTNTLSADGIVWRYVGTINSKDAEFVTGEFIPLTIVDKPIVRDELISAKVLGFVGTFDTVDNITYTNNLGFKLNFELNPSGEVVNPFISVPGYFNQDVTVKLHKKDIPGTDATARCEIIKGAISSVVVENNGIDYTQGATVIIVGDGTGATATPVIDRLGAITRIDITNAGQDYTTAQAYIVPGDAGVVVQLNKIDVSPSSMLHSLQADAMLFNVSIDDVAGYLDSSARYDGISILTNANKNQHLHIGDGLHKIDKQNAIVLWNKAISPKQRSEGQKEKILIAITME